MISLQAVAFIDKNIGNPGFWFETIHVCFFSAIFQPICMLRPSSIYFPCHFSHDFLLTLHDQILGVTASPATCPPGYFGQPPSCSCLEDNTAYFGNNAKVGSENLQPSQSACQKSCLDHPECEFWTWGKGTPSGPCYLKHARDNVTPGLDSYISGSKHCPLPEAKGNYTEFYPCMILRGYGWAAQGN